MYDPIMKESLLRSERLADGEISDSTMQKWRQKLDRAERARWKTLGKRANDVTPERTAFNTVWWACNEGLYSRAADCWTSLVRNNREMGEDFVRRGVALAHATLLEVFGNPFRSVAFSPAWRTDTAVLLARS